MKTNDFNYHLPLELIAQRPLPQRDASRLMVLHRANGRLEHRRFTDLLDYLRPGDILVGNNSRVIPARLFGQKPTGGKVEILLLENLDPTRWQALVGGKKLQMGAEILLENKDGLLTDVTAAVTAVLDGPQRELTFSRPIDDDLESLGHTPLPPYIHETLDDAERYQTVYSRPPGSSAAPTAGLHFTGDLLMALRDKGVLFETVTLHVGLDTFKPVEADRVADHVIHSEWASLTTEAARRINDAKLAGGRLIAVGTTAVRTLETAACRSAGILGTLQTISARDAAGETSNMCPWKPVAAFEGPTDLFIYPGYKFRAVDALITNFHLPQSSLLMLVSAFADRAQIMQAYDTAVADQYRFFSFGDAMLMV
ncbi:MAG: tRNA preQ1(34) S-adenosylmethionine ribosyltransferase-isomerase QueA [Chloroflexi bacterium]|nr:tRNA preQ1(34) S-adenosylmethionine ribosyltransferase-isomerase QueA [Chloroflexota bacterium]MBK6713297.1 tRNA preQ1(34) S-adenosylmethionine ribosyltransferase-isomerase QueA [Chloroflexota bacterium]MBP7593316.1 tRNA preQ1(34) S-adenosylmethionine ribosyltransferase-isomerase QueA [Chloroflexota bacterium]